MPRPKGSKNKVPGVHKWERAKLTVKKKARAGRKSYQTRLAQEAFEKEQARKESLTPIQTDSERIYHALKQQPLVWGRVYFPHRMGKATPKFHIDIINSALTNRFLAIAAPRESAKSELLSFVYPFHGIIFKRFRFIVILSNTFTKASMFLEAMKIEIRENERLKGSVNNLIQISKDAEGDSEFRHPDGFTTKVLCKGRDQIGSVRGIKFGAYRPDLIVCDDIEDDKSVENPDLRLELERNYDEALTPAGDREKCQYIIIGTILHDDGQIAKMVKHEGRYLEYKKLYYQAHLFPNTDQEASLWPEKWTITELRSLRDNKPLVYAKEMQNDPVAGLAQVISQDDFRYWRMEHNQYVLLDKEQSKIAGMGSLKDCKAAIACDLAWKEKRSADFCVVMPGFLTPNSDILVGTYIARKGMRPDEIEELLFSMEARLKALTGSVVPIGFEQSMLENVTQWLLKEAMRKRNQFLLTQKLSWDADKIERIKVRLQPRYAQHVIYHQHGQGELENQLVRFPSASHDDLPDALQGLIQLLQYPKKPKGEVEQDDPFMRLRQYTINQKRNQLTEGKGLYQLNNRAKLMRKINVHYSPLSFP